jgi:hypothetical protein
MRALEFITESSNVSSQNAINKMIHGYQHGRDKFRTTCYAYVGEKLKELNAKEATIRFWGLKPSTIVHGDAVLKDGTVVSSISPEKYKTNGYELVDTIQLKDLLNKINESSIYGGYAVKPVQKIEKIPNTRTRYGQIPRHQDTIPQPSTLVSISPEARKKYKDMKNNPDDDIEEGWKSTLAGAAMVGLGALGGAGHAQAADDQGAGAKAPTQTSQSAGGLQWLDDPTVPDNLPGKVAGSRFPTRAPVGTKYGSFINDKGEKINAYVDHELTSRFVPDKDGEWKPQSFPTNAKVGTKYGSFTNDKGEKIDKYVGYDLTTHFQKASDGPWNPKKASVNEAIKLSSSTHSDKSKRFIDDVNQKYQASPLNPRYRVMIFGKNNDMQIVQFELKALSDDKVEISWIQATPMSSGAGSKAMKILQDMANKAGVKLSLYAWDKGVVSRKNLLKFYKKHGFKQISTSGNMEWKPDDNTN